MSESAEPSNPWFERLAAQDFSGRAKAVENIARALRDKYPDDDERVFIHLLNIAGSVRRYGTSSDPFAISQGMITRLEQSVGQLTVRLNEIANQEAPDAVLSLDPLYADAVTDALASWPEPEPDTVLEVESERVDRMVIESTEAFGKVQEFADDAIKAVELKIDTEAGLAADKISDLTSRLDDLNTKIIGQDELISQHEAKLLEQLSNQSGLFDASQSDRAQKFTDELEQRVEIIAKIRTDLQEESKESVASLQRFEGEASEILGAIARTGMAAGYQIESDSEKIEADKWRTYAVRFAIAAVVLLIGAVIWDRADASSNWTVDLGRILVSILVAGISSYAARQSGAHRRRSVSAKRSQLELASIGPYLEVVPKEKRDDVLIALAFKFFGDAGEKEAPSDGEVGPTNVSLYVELLKLLKH